MVAEAPPSRSTATTTPKVSGTRAIDRALDVLACFTRGDGDRGIAEIAQETGLATSTAHRIARSLVGRGYLQQQDSPSGRYRLGPSSVVLGRVAQRSLGLDEAIPILRELAELTGATVNLGIRHASRVVVLAHIASQHPLRFEQPVGTEVALHASAMGKCCLAHPGGTLQAPSGPLDALTPATIVDADRLEAEVAEVRDRGYSTDLEESVVGVRCVGAPILRGQGRAVAAVAVQAPAVRLPSERIPELAEAVTDAARRIEFALEASGPVAAEHPPPNARTNVRTGSVKEADGYG